MAARVGIYGVGFFLPAHVRTNDFWPEATVAGWREKFARVPPEDLSTAWSKGSRLVMQAMNEQRGDAFKGARERRILDADKLSSEMEIAAARDAIARSGVDPQSIDLVLTQSVCPDFLNTPNACLIHHALGLREDCFTMNTEGMCNSFLLQLTVAEQMIKSGQARHALIVQSTLIPRFISPAEPFSAWFGDGATATVLGPVSEGRGIKSAQHRTNGSKHKALVFGIPKRRWYEDGPVVLYTDEARLAHKMLLDIPDRGAETVDRALEAAGITKSDVGFYACHQATSWFRSVTQELCGLTAAKYVDHFPWTGSLSGCNVPLQLALAEREGLLRDGTNAVLFSGATGETWGSAVLTWGR
jgi:3-oxoacyl-[acyl-carrier-protein] synthase III